MDQERVGDLEQSVGYLLKQVVSTLRAGMDEVLRPLELTVPQYACLELLGRDPGLSSSELARRAFVTRQSMNLVLRRLQDRGLLARPGRAPHGRALPTRLTKDGETILAEASVAVRRVEKELFAPLSEAQQRRMRTELAACLPPVVEAAQPD